MSRVLLATCARLPNGDEDAGALVVGPGLLRSSGAVGRVGRPVRRLVPRPHRAALDVGLHGPPGPSSCVGRPPCRVWSIPPSVVSWSSDKRYLADLQAAGLPIVATRFAAPRGACPVARGRPGRVRGQAVGGRGIPRRRPLHHRRARRRTRPRRRPCTPTAAPCSSSPTSPAVDTAGETALVYVDGTFSHAIRKGPMLPVGDRARADGHRPVRARGHCGPRPRALPRSPWAVGVLEYVTARFGAAPLYARVDLLPAPDGPVVVELELVEPSLFLGHSPTPRRRRSPPPSRPAHDRGPGRGCDRRSGRPIRPPKDRRSPPWPTAGCGPCAG